MKHIRHFSVSLGVCAILLSAAGCDGSKSDQPAPSDISQLKTPDQVLKEATAKDAPARASK